jgi:hypothetical protein
MVHVETYLSGDWDSTLEEEAQEFAELESALVWLAEKRGVAASELSVPTHPAREQREHGAVRQRWRSTVPRSPTIQTSVREATHSWLR